MFSIRIENQNIYLKSILAKDFILDKIDTDYIGFDQIKKKLTKDNYDKFIKHLDLNLYDTKELIPLHYFLIIKDIKFLDEEEEIQIIWESLSKTEEIKVDACLLKFLDFGDIKWEKYHINNGLICSNVDKNNIKKLQPLDIKKEKKLIKDFVKFLTKNNIKYKYISDKDINEVFSKGNSNNEEILVIDFNDLKLVLLHLHTDKSKKILGIYMQLENIYTIYYNYCIEYEKFKNKLQNTPSQIVQETPSQIVQETPSQIVQETKKIYPNINSIKEEDSKKHGFIYIASSKTKNNKYEHRINYATNLEESLKSLNKTHNKNYFISYIKRVFSTDNIVHLISCLLSDIEDIQEKGLFTVGLHALINLINFIIDNIESKDSIKSLVKEKVNSIGNKLLHKHHESVEKYEVKKLNIDINEIHMLIDKALDLYVDKKKKYVVYIEKNRLVDSILNIDPGMKKFDNQSLWRLIIYYLNWNSASEIIEHNGYKFYIKTK